MKKKVLFIILFVISFVFLMPSINAASYTIYRANSSCNVRIGPGTNYSIIKNGSDNVKVQTNQDLDFLSKKNGTVNGAHGEWYEVKFDYATRQYSGYVWSNCVDVKTATYYDDVAFENSINGFPNTYKPYLRKLHAEYNNWVFTPDYNNLTWSDVVSSESQKGVSAVSNLYPSLYFKDSLNPNGIVIDGNSWYAACSDAVGYFLDPRNFLSSKYVFMFEKLSYDESQNAAVDGIFSGTFMSGTFTENGVTKSYKEAFIEAAKASNISVTHLASRAVQEVGAKEPTSAVSGKVSGYEGFYNFFNIGATSGSDNYIKGLNHAKNSGWNSISKAIKGGAEFLASKYINKGQNTIYFQKFNTSSYSSYNTYTHQYMTNIMAPRSEASNIYNSYKNLNRLNSKYTFVIPVYNSMPGDSFKLSRTDTVGGSTPASSSSNSTQTTVNPDTKVNSVGFKVNGSYITGISYGTNVSSLTSKLSASSSKSTGNIATGDKVTVSGKTYEVVIYGDLSGDGVINIKDLLLLKKHLLKDGNLSGSYLEAAKISKSTTASIKDLLLLKKQLLGQYTISQ